MSTPFKMKGMDFGNSPLSQTKFPKAPNSLKERKEKKKKDVDPFSIDEQAYENAQNDYDTSNPTKAQIAASKKEIFKERKPKSGDMKKYSDLEKYDDDK
tara:strand:- start:236 stop:532 length:297 start_codon:yes stop_codon:yes gene_type:complete